MKKLVFSLLAMIAACQSSYSQAKIITTGNNLIDPANPYSADVVIGSDANGGARHDASILFWSSGSASRVFNTNDILYFSQWSTTNANAAINAAVGGSSYFQGNLGIGTSTPIAPIQIAKTGLNSGADYAALHITTSGNGNIYGPILYLNASSTTNGRMWGLVSSGPLDASATGATGNFAVYDATANATRLSIDPSGNVAIGTTDAKGYKLAVNGSLIATSIKVKSYANWPDYVFKPTYNLRPLSEVKAYIDQNQHLPEVPAAATVEKEGMDVAEMNKILLKKVEELTLYLIEKDAKDKKQQEQIETLINKVNSLESKGHN